MLRSHKAGGQGGITKRSGYFDFTQHEDPAMLRSHKREGIEPRAEGRKELSPERAFL